MSELASRPVASAAGPAPATGDIAERWNWYDRLRGVGEIVWDEEREAWLVLSHRLAKELGRGEGTTFLSAMAYERDGFLGLDWETYCHYQGGAHRVNILTGEQHTKVHRWWMAAFAPRVLATWREEVIRPVVDAQLDRHVKDGKADLGRLANGIHIRMIAGTVGMPWDDDEWMNRWEDVTTRNQRLKWHMADNDVPQAIIDDALAASEEMRAELLKWVRMHSGGEGDYLISMMWRDFPALFDDFDEEDVLANLKPAFETNSTRAAIRNALYALATHPELHDDLLSGELEIGRFVEETFRLYSGLGTARIALDEMEFGGVRIGKGEMIVSIVGAVNVDPERYECPHAIDTERAGPRDHFLFNQGPRACPGQNLGRAELEETVMGTLRRMPGLRLDPDAEQPSYHVVGNDARWDPLHALYDNG